MGRGSKSARGKAKPAVSRKSRTNEDARVRDLEKRLAEALQREAEALRQLQTSHHERAEAQEQQTATAEILRVISQSPTDIQSVFETVLQRAVRLCAAGYAALFRFDGSQIHLAAAHNLPPDDLESVSREYPMSPMRGKLSGRAILSRDVAQVADILADPDYRPTQQALSFGVRSILAVPMVRSGDPVGAILIYRREVGLFPDEQVMLLQTFADQAVIAIENVRLFTELQEKNRALTESLEQQTATSEILEVISSSPTDIQPVLDAIVESAAGLCEANDVLIRRVDDDMMRVVAHMGSVPIVQSAIVQPISPESVGGRSILERRTIHINDVLEPHVGKEYPKGLWTLFRNVPYRTMLVVPLVREDTAIGTIAIRRPEVRPFSDKQIKLLETFADQAVIAIENVRLFNETKEALDQQTATADILRVISSSLTDTQPVFDAIAESAARLCSANDTQVLRVEGDILRLVAAYGATSMPSVRQLTRGHLVGRSVIDRRTIHVRDLAQALAEYPETTAARYGVQSALAVPLLRDGAALGVIRISRTEIQPFTDKQIALLQTFADQAVIAIENVRLFKELETRNRDLTEALDQQTATAEILKVISGSPTDVQPVFDTIVRSAAHLCNAHTTAVFLTDGQLVYHPAAYGDVPEALTAIKAQFPRPLDRETVSGTAILTRSVVHVPDVEAPSALEFARQTGRVVGFRSLLSVPMLRQGEAVGAINVTRREPGPFPDVAVALLQTFADQAVIAIENVRLFKELEAANRELAAASQHKSEFLANMSHELRTPLNAIIGFSEVLSEKMFGELNEKQEEYSKDIHASGQHLLSLINDILDLSKIEAGRMELELSDFHLPTALESALTLVRERAGRRSVALRLSVDERLGQVQADERKVRQVVLNLLSNAIKFTPEGGQIKVMAAPKDGVVEMSVSDTGVGIAPEDQEAVFEEFRQVGTADKKVEGTGLGLTLCRKFVELHGGKIWVKSQLGAGSTFTFTIPTGK